MSSLAQLEIEYQRLVAEREFLSDQFEAGQKDLLPRIRQLSARIRVLAIEIDSLIAYSSSGKIVQDDQTARVSDSETINPSGGELILRNGRIQTPPGTSSGSNAIRVPQPEDIGTNDALRPLTLTQQTPVTTVASDENLVQSQTGATNRAGGSSINQIRPSGTIGVGSPSDDRGSVADVGEIVITADRPVGNTNATVESLNSIDFDKELVPRGNTLDQYASYSYQASLYLMNKESYQTMVNTGRKSLGGAKLLVQTGGSDPSERNEFFGLDYYIDSIELKSFIAGKSTRLAHNVSEVKMTVVEPNGISFIQNLDAAVQQFLGGRQNSKRNFTAQIYLLVIRFYGYDDQGNLVRGGVAKPDGSSDPNAFVEKWYPLIISKINFKVASKVVEYEIEAKAPPYYINASQGRGTIPYNMELSGQTLREMLAGPGTYTTSNRVNAGGIEAEARRPTATAPAKANAAQTNKKTVRTGLMTALNNYQQELLDKQLIQYKDEYEIEFASEALAAATVVNTGLNIGATAMSTPGTAAGQKLGTKQSMDPTTRGVGATAGMQIVQYIDMLVRNSSYIKEQQTLVINEKTGQASNTGINLKNTAWYKISFQAEAKMDQYDEKRNGYAYKIKYIVSPYKITQLNSPYFKPPTFNGVHKQYRYWFTGENTQVISYEETLNALYYIAMTGGNFGGATSSANNAARVSELLQYQPQTASGQTTQGAEGRTLEPAANAADQLYSPSDLKEADVTIVGDPAWLQQGEAFNGIPKGAPYYFSAFLPDGTINFDSQQVLFEIGYNAPADYNLATGLAEPARGRSNTTAQLDQTIRSNYGGTQESRIYIAKEVRSQFVRGKFTQNLKGSLMIYYPNKSPDVGRPTPQSIAPATNRTASNQAAPAVSKAPPWAKPTSVTGQTPTSSTARGVQQILNPVTNGQNLTDSQLRTTPIYNQSRRSGATDATALAAARAASAAGTNNYSGSALPGIRVPNQQIVKDQ